MLHFVTGNDGKFQTMKRYADAAGIPVVQQRLDLIEPQANTVEEISRSKAEQAFRILREPLIVNDAALYIDALNGFPGPYAKFVMDTIGVDGVRALMERFDNRRARFIGVLTYIDQQETKVFEDITEGSLATDIDRNPEPLHHWSDMHRLFIPKNCSKPFSAFTQEEIERYFVQRSARKNMFVELMEWLKTKER